MGLIPTTQREGKIANSKYYWPLKPCPRGHIGPYITSGRVCVECARIYHLENRAHRLAKMKEYSKKTSAYNIARAKEWASKNREKRREICAKYREANRDKLRAANKRLYESDKPKQFAHANARRARKKRALPKWADMEKIKNIYRESRRISDETGIKHCVDHIYPLVGKTVCGLHVEFNLRIITMLDNFKKNNKHPDEISLNA